MKEVTGIGTKFRKWVVDAWVDIAKITSISGPNMSRDTIEVTTFDSMNGYKEFLGSLRDGGDVSFSMNFTREGLDLMKADFDDDCPQDYVIELNDGAAECGGVAGVNTVFEFQGLVTELPLSIEVASQITMDVTIKVIGVMNVQDAPASTPA